MAATTAPSRPREPTASRLADAAYRRCVPLRDYHLLMAQVHEHLLPRTYLEVGVGRGRTLTLALQGTRAVGVDPAPRLEFALSRDTELARRDPRAVFGGLPVDLAFVDGMHLFEFALRDFTNVERWSTPDSTVLVHDCLPLDERAAGRQPPGGQWNGDVWKLVVVLKRWRPDLRISVIDVPPGGLGVVRGLDPASTVLSDHYEEIVAEGAALSYSLLTENDRHEVLNVVPNAWRRVAALLPATPYRRDNASLLRWGVAARYVRHTAGIQARRVARRLERLAR